MFCFELLLELEMGNAVACIAILYFRETVDFNLQLCFHIVYVWRKSSKAAAFQVLFNVTHTGAYCVMDILFHK